MKESSLILMQKRMDKLEQKETKNQVEQIKKDEKK